MQASEAQFIQRMEDYGVQGGLPRSASRILAYLTICEPSVQSADAIGRKLSLSTGSVSTALTLLRRVGLIDRSLQPGSRRHYYELSQDGWKRSTLQQLRMLKEVINIAEEGLKVAPDNQRLLAMRDIFILFDKEFERIAKKLEP